MLREELNVWPTYRLDWRRDSQGTGWACIVYTHNAYGRPERISVWWPICPSTRGWLEELCGPLEGVKVRSVGAPEFGAFELYHSRPSAYPDTIVHLRDGGATRPIHSEAAPIPPPRVRKGTRVRWENFRGRWEKHSRQGWVEA